MSALRDLKNHIITVFSNALATYNTNQAENGAEVITEEGESVAFLVLPGTVTDGTHTPKLQHRDTSSDSPPN